MAEVHQNIHQVIHHQILIVCCLKFLGLYPFHIIIDCMNRRLRFWNSSLLFCFQNSSKRNIADIRLFILLLHDLITFIGSYRFTSSFSTKYNIHILWIFDDNIGHFKFTHIDIHLELVIYDIFTRWFFNLFFEIINFLFLLSKQSRFRFCLLRLFCLCDILTYNLLYFSFLFRSNSIRIRIHIRQNLISNQLFLGFLFSDLKLLICNCIRFEFFRSRSFSCSLRPHHKLFDLFHHIKIFW